MNMFARFDENPAMTLRVIKETKRYGRTDARTDARTDGQRENSIPPTNKVCGGYKNLIRQKTQPPGGMAYFDNKTLKIFSSETVG